MKSTQDLYKDVLKEEISKNDFLHQIRKDPRLSPWITPLLTYDDTINILISKGLITELFVSDDGLEDDENIIKPGSNVAFDLLSKLDAGEGDETDDEYLHDFSGYGDDAEDPRKAFSINEEGIEDYTAAFNSVVDKIKAYEQEHGGSDSGEREQFIQSAISEFGLGPDQAKNLQVDVFDYMNHESGTEYNDEAVMEDISLQSLYESANPTHNIDVKHEYPQFDGIHLNQLLRGARWEFEASGKKDWDASYSKAGNNLLKDPLYYLNKFTGNKTPKKRTDLPIVVKKGNYNDKANAMEVLKKDSKKQSRLRPGSKTKSPKPKVTHMTQKAKGAKGVKSMPVPGKPKKVKSLRENLENLIKTVLKEEIQKKKPLTENTDLDSQKQYILQHVDVIRQKEQVTPEWLDSQTNLYINKLYQAVLAKVGDNDALGDDDPEFHQLQEIKATEIKEGSTFTMAGDLESLKKGDKVTVIKVEDQGTDVHIILENEAGVQEDFYLDPNDTMDLNENQDCGCGCGGSGSCGHNHIDEEGLSNKIGPTGVDKNKQIIVSGFSQEYPIQRIAKYLKGIGIPTQEENGELIAQAKGSHAHELSRTKGKIANAIYNAGFQGVEVNLIIR